MSYPEAPFLSRTELPLQNTHTTGGTGGPGRRASGQTTLQTSSNRSNVKPLARTLVTNVVNLRPKTTIFSEKAVGLTTFVTTDRKSTQKHLRLTTFVTTSNRSARNRSSLGPCDAHGRHHSGQAPLVWRAPEGPEGLAAVPVGGGEAWPGFEATHRATSATGPHWCEGRRRDRRARAGCKTWGLAAVPVGGGGAWPGFETTRRAKLAARTARGRAAAHGHTKQPGPQPGNARRSSPSEPCARAGASRPGRSGFGPRCAAPRLRCR